MLNWPKYYGIWIKALSISTGAQYVTLDNSKFSFFFFGNPTNQTVTGTAYTWELLIANHLDESLWSSNQKYWAAVRSNLLDSFLEVHTCVEPFTSQGKQRPISWAKLAHFDFFAIILLSGVTYWAPVEMLLGPL